MRSSNGFVLLDQNMMLFQRSKWHQAKSTEIRRRISKIEKALARGDARSLKFQAIDPRLDRCPMKKIAVHRLAIATILLRVPFVCFISQFARVCRRSTTARET